MTRKDRLSLVAALAALASGLALAPLTRDRTYLMLAGFLLFASVCAGLVARRLVRSEPVVRLLQVLPVVLLGWLVPETLHPVKLTIDTFGYIQQASAPMPFQIGFAVLCVLLVWIAYLVIESLVNGADAPGWTFVPLITPFLVTAAFGYFEASAWLFAMPAAGYGLVLATHARTRVVDGPATDAFASFAAQSWRRGIGRAAAVATVGAIVLTVLAGLTLPENTHLAAPRAGPGGVRFNDPSLDLIRNLNSASDDPVLSYRTTSSVGVSLRLAALPVLDDTGFHAADTDLRGLPLQSYDGPEGSTPVATTVTVTDFSSEYLPVPWTPVDVNLPDTWKWDASSLAVIATGSTSTVATRNLRYRVRSSQAPTLEELLPRTRSVSPDGRPLPTLAVPQGLSPQAHELVTRLTEGRATAGEKVLALRNYLRSDLFTYSTETAPGTTTDTLNDFLFGSRTGYCEQFAGAMAVLARIAGVPSRVIVGFRPGTKTGDAWQVTPHDMHAWAEVYFEGLGWIAVDATPPSVFAVQPTASASAAPSPTRSVAEPTVLPSSVPTHESPTGPTVGDQGPDVTGILALSVLVLAAAGAAPGLVRRLQRSLRLSGWGRQPLEDAWDEVWAVARDRRAPWPPGSTRAVASQLADELQGPAGGELTALALAVERERYAPAGEPDEPAGVPLSARVAVVRSAIERRWPTRRLLDRWWPRSLWPRSRRVTRG